MYGEYSGIKGKGKIERLDDTDHTEKTKEEWDYKLQKMIHIRNVRFVDFLLS